MWQIIRKVLWSIILILVLINVWCGGADKGYEWGYGTAMANVLLQFDTPENYFIKRFDIKTPRKVQQRQELHND